MRTDGTRMAYASAMLAKALVAADFRVTDKSTKDDLRQALYRMSNAIELALDMLADSPR